MVKYDVYPDIHDVWEELDFKEIMQWLIDEGDEKAIANCKEWIEENLEPLLTVVDEIASAKEKELEDDN